MKNEILPFIIMVFVLFPVIQEAHACSCVAPADYVAATAESEYVFTGTVTHIDNSLGPQKVHFDVSSVIKGDIPSKKFVLENSNIVNNGQFSKQSSCDVGYKVGVTYNVFVYDNEFMNNGMCTTKPVGFLGIMNPFQYNLFHIVIVSLAVTAGAATAVFVIRKRRRR